MCFRAHESTSPKSVNLELIPGTKIHRSIIDRRLSILVSNAKHSEALRYCTPADERILYINLFSRVISTDKSPSFKEFPREPKYRRPKNSEVAEFLGWGLKRYESALRRARERVQAALDS